MEQSKTLIYLVAVLILLTALNLVIGVVNITKSPVNTATPEETETPVVTGMPYGDDGLTGACSATRPCNGDFVCEAGKCVAVHESGGFELYQSSAVSFRYPDTWYRVEQETPTNDIYNFYKKTIFDSKPIQLSEGGESFFPVTVYHFQASGSAIPPENNNLIIEIAENGERLDTQGRLYRMVGRSDFGDLPFEAYLYKGEDEVVVLYAFTDGFNDSAREWASVWEEIKKTIEWK